MKKAGKALSGLLAAAVLAAAAAVVVLPIYRQQKQQDETLLGQTEQSTFAETEQSLKMRESPLAMSLYRNKQHILLAGEPGGQTSYDYPGKTVAEILDAVQPGYEAVTRGTVLPPLPESLYQGEQTSGYTTWFACQVYGVYQSSESTYLYASWEPATGQLVRLNINQPMPLSEYGAVLENMQSHTLCEQLMQNYLQLLGLPQEDFAQPKPMAALRTIMETDSSDYVDYCFLYSEEYQLYVYCTLRANTDENSIYLSSWMGVCSFTPDELERAVNS